MRWGGAGFLLAASLATSAAGAEVHPGDSVPGHPGLTYLDLARQALPSLATNAGANAIEGHLPDPPPRHLGGKRFEGEPPDPVTLGWMQDQRIRAGGQSRMVILADLGPDPDRVQSQTLLLLFDDAPKPRLLDVADVGVDRDTEFDEQHPRLPLGPGDDALVTISEHGEADITYDGRLLLFVRHDRFQLITRVFVINARACNWRQRQSVSFRTKPDPGSPYAAVHVIVRHSLKAVPEAGCGQPGPRTNARSYAALFRWDPKRGRFATSSSELKALDKLNSEGF